MAKSPVGRTSSVIPTTTRSGSGRRSAPCPDADNTAEYYRSKIEAPWFAYWLKDKGPLQQPEAMVFETGSNRWKSYDAWPPERGVTKRKLYFHGSGKLSFDPPAAGNDEFDSYVSDLDRPLPYVPLPITPNFFAGGW